ncbi:kinesin-like protein KIN-12B [Tanacetum coccineum]
MKSRKQICYRENVPPSDKNIIPDSFPSQSSALQLSRRFGNVRLEASRLSCRKEQSTNLYTERKCSKEHEGCNGNAMEVVRECWNIMLIKEKHIKVTNNTKGAQLRDTAEAVQAAGELLVRLKDAEEAAAAAEARAREAEQENENAYKVIDSLKRKQENVASHPLYDIAMYNDDKEPNTTSDDPQWRNEFENFYSGNEGELTNLPVPSWWSFGYDTCNI